MKKLFIVFFIILSGVFLTGATDMDYVINAEANAAKHNNLGIVYLQEKYYYGAIKEFEIAIRLNPNTQASAIYYNNLGRTYIIIGYPELAESNFLQAIRKFPLNFEFYKNLVDAYGKLDCIEQKLQFYKKNRKNKFDDITIGLLYGAKGDIKTELTILDEFCENEPDLIITPALRKYIQEQAMYLNVGSEYLN